MYQQKKQRCWNHPALMIAVCLTLDVLLLALFSVRFVHWSAAAFVVSLVIGAPFLCIVTAAWASVIVATLLHGKAVDEIALTTLVGSLGLFLIQQTAASLFARRLVASCLIFCCVVGTSMLQAPNMSFWILASPWTILKIIANIVIVNLLLKYMS